MTLTVCSSNSERDGTTPPVVTDADGSTAEAGSSDAGGSGGGGAAGSGGGGSGARDADGGAPAGGSGGSSSEPADCGSVPQDEMLRCVCIEAARTGETLPDQVAQYCAENLGQTCCAEDEVCLRGSASAECVPRPDGCDVLNCDCFDTDPCGAVGLGVCGVARGWDPELSRELTCHFQ